MDLRRQGLVLLLMMTVSATDYYTDHGFPIYDMNSLCGESLRIPGDIHAGRITFRTSASTWSNYRNGSCTFSIVMPYYKIAVAMSDVYLGDNCDSNLQIGAPINDTDSKFIVGIPASLTLGAPFAQLLMCTDTASSEAMYVTGDTLVLNFTAGTKIPDYYNIRFHVDFNCYTAGPLDCAYYDLKRCPWTERCVHSDLWCLGLNPCGDNFDTDTCIDSTTPDDSQTKRSFSSVALGFVVATPAVITAIVLTIIVCRLYRRGKRRLREQVDAPMLTPSDVRFLNERLQREAERDERRERVTCRRLQLREQLASTTGDVSATGPAVPPTAPDLRDVTATGPGAIPTASEPPTRRLSVPDTAVNPPPTYSSLDHADPPPSYTTVMANHEVYKISGSMSEIVQHIPPTPV